jgi:hypothetical protein
VFRYLDGTRVRDAEQKPDQACDESRAAENNIAML